MFDRVVMRILKIAGFLLAISIAWSAIIQAATGRTFDGVVSVGEMLGMALVLFLVAAVGAAFGLVGPKARATPVLTPVVTGGITATAGAVLVLTGAAVQSGAMPG